MRPVYGNECFKRPAIHVFGVKFAHGHESVVDEEGTGRRGFFDDRCNDRSSRFPHTV